jgi:hypothetical protein
MNETFNAWKIMQDNMLAAQKMQLEAATKLMGMGEHFGGALEAAQKIADANMKAWETWLGVWGVKK